MVVTVLKVVPGTELALGASVVATVLKVVPELS